jgi:hypothetical protein
MKKPGNGGEMIGTLSTMSSNDAEQQISLSPSGAI